MAHDMVSLGERRRSKNRRRPKATFSRVRGLLSGTGRGVGRPRGRTTADCGLRIADWEDAELALKQIREIASQKTRAFMVFGSSPPVYLPLARPSRCRSTRAVR